ncbi:UNVERIFIED_CONTAM: Na/Pi cotransporter family protein [Halobacillus marinus]|uniref:Na/Pi cotransporter family protein n=1 Tax=Bacillaceae TaxID=186817 RepID=UPI0002A50A71|nr:MULTISPECIES: Na/Pi cotransporter family protein [Bacillaceae]ELK45464.1 putative Na/Pi-cotransporter family protein [Halobacillus sp. BAB-2008]QHT47176.1 Na/Pi cotransporter family protein [Bacillus sp. SB49]
MDINVQQMIFEFIGGLGIFLFGIKYMGDGLQKVAGDRLRELLDRFTSNPLMGVIAGMVVTILVQSSSTTTVLTVGLVNAGFMTFRQAIGVIMGANIGTTFTAFIIGIDIKAYGLPILAVGALMIFFFKNKKVTNIGQTVFGLGSLFFGLELMSGGMKPLRSLEAFHELTLSMSENPILGVVIGTLFTVIVQSSSATIGILQGLFGEGLVDLKAALPVLFGDNIGTTITAVIAAIGASVGAKRAATVHVIFNVIGATVFLILLHPFTLYVGWLQDKFNLGPEMTIAFAHGSFNIANTIVQFPFVAFLAWLVVKLVPGDDSLIDHKPQHLDPIFIEQSPSLALDQAKEEVVRMGEYAYKGLEETSLYLNSKQQKHSEIALQIEEALNNLDRKITDYLVDLSQASLTDEESKKHSTLMDSVRDIERMGDHFENIIELIDYKNSNKVNLTPQAIEDLNTMIDLTLMTVKQSIKSLETMSREEALAVVQKENELDRMERSYRKKHIIRLNEGVCTGQAGIVFVDMISNLERIGDHAVNIAEEVLGEKESL